MLHTRLSYQNQCSTLAKSLLLVEQKAVAQSFFRVVTYFARFVKTALLVSKYEEKSTILILLRPSFFR